MNNGQQSVLRLHIRQLVGQKESSYKLTFTCKFLKFIYISRENESFDTKVLLKKTQVFSSTIRKHCNDTH